MRLLHKERKPNYPTVLNGPMEARMLLAMTIKQQERKQIEPLYARPINYTLLIRGS